VAAVRIGDLFRRRRERESALPPGAVEELSAEVSASPESEPVEPDSDAAADPVEVDRDPKPGDATELPGADAAELGAMLRRAAATGLPQVSTESHTVDRQEGLAKEVLGILGQGVGGAGGAQEVDPDELRNLHERAREALRRQGVDPDSGEPRRDRR
jgi:hypothetical protein